MEGGVIGKDVFFLLLMFSVIFGLGRSGDVEVIVETEEARGAVVTSVPSFNLSDFFPLQPNNLWDPTGPNPRCVSRSEVSFAAFPECEQFDFGYDLFYIDDNQEHREQQFSIFAPTFRVSPEPCLSGSFALFCRTTWRPCAAIDGLPVLAHNPCRDLCEEWSVCAEIAVAIGGELFRPLFDCENPHPLVWGKSNYTIFPYSNNTVYNLSITDPVLYDNVTVFLPCIDANQSKINVVCPDELVQDGQLCSMGCPLALLSSGHYATLKVAISTFSWISFFCCLVLVILWLSPFKRKFPNNMPLWFILCVGMSSFALTFGSFVGYEKMLCKDDSEPNDFGGPACTVQGILWVYFTLAGVAWYLALAINMLVSLLFPKNKFFQKYGPYVYHVAWLVPLVPLIIGLANERIGYGGDLWCTVHLTDPTVVMKVSPIGVRAESDKNVFFWKLGLLMVPISVFVFCGILVIATVFLILITKGEFTGKFLLSQWRLGLFLGFYLWIYIFLFIFWSVLRSNIDDQLYAYEDYLYCFYYENCSLDRTVSFGLWLTACLIVSSQGILVFIIFGTAPALWKGWFAIIARKASFVSGTSREKHSPTPTTMDTFQSVEGAFTAKM